MARPDGVSALSLLLSVLFLTGPGALGAADLPPEPPRSAECATHTGAETLHADRIHVIGFGEGPLPPRILEQRKQAAAFLDFVLRNRSGGPDADDLAAIEIRPLPLARRMPWTAVAELVRGRSRTAHLHPGTSTLVLEIPWYPVIGYRIFSDEDLRRHFYRLLHLDRVDRVIRVTRRRVREIGMLRRERWEEIRAGLAHLAERSVARLDAILEKARESNAATIRLDIAGLVRGEIALSEEDTAYLDRAATDTLIRVLELGREELASGAVASELGDAISAAVRASRAEVVRNVWDWRVSIAPIVVRSQDIGQIHVWSESPGPAGDLVQAPMQNRLWNLHFNLALVLVDTLDDYDIRVLSRIALHPGAETVLALRHAIDRLRAGPG